MKKSNFSLLLIEAAITLVLFLSGCAVKSAYFKIATPLTKTTLDLSNANYVVIEHSIEEEYDHDGTSTRLERKVVKILTKEGLNKSRVVRAHYNPTYNETEIVRVHVIKEDGKVLDIPLTTIKDIPSPGRTIFWGDRMKVLSVDGLEVGDILEYIIKQNGGLWLGPSSDEEIADRKFYPPYRGEFNTIVLFQEFEPIIYKRYTLTGPADKPIRWLVTNGELDFHQEHVGNKMVYTWEKCDAEKILYEPMMGSIYDIATKLLVTTFKSWEQMGQFEYKLAKDNVVPDAAIKETVDSLLMGVTDPIEKMRKLFYYVAENIRYLGLIVGDVEGYEPHAASLTFKEKAGVCKDKAALLVAMLKAAGFDAYYTITEVGARIDDIPVDQTNHAIVAVEFPPGEYMYLDPTIGAGGQDLIPSIEQGQEVHIARPGGDKLRKIPYIPPDKNELSLVAQTKLKDDGSLISSLTIKAKGHFDRRYRRQFRDLEPKKQKQILQSYLSSISTDAVLLDYSISDPKDFYTTFTINLKYSIPSYGIRKGNILLFRPTTLKRKLIAQVFDDLGYATSLPKRKYQLYLWTTEQIAIDEEIAFPTGYVVKAIPDPVLAEGKTSGLQVLYKQEESTINFKKQFSLKMTKIFPPDYKELKNNVELDRAQDKGWIVLEKSQK